MSDFLIVRGIEPLGLRVVFETWRAGRKRVKSIEVRNAWELQELEINRRNVVKHKQGKHKLDLAQLVVLIQLAGGCVIHVKLHRSRGRRIEEDLSEWARRHNNETK